jgi:hypothetical protein
VAVGAPARVVETYGPGPTELRVAGDA